MEPGVEAGALVAGGLAEPLADEVERVDLIELLGRRWNTRLVTIEAPGGYGKSTLSAQAIRDNATDPSGIDVYIRCARAHRTVDDVLAELLGALGRAQPADGQPVSEIASALAAVSPTSVAMWIDDAHLLTDHVEREQSTAVVDLLDALPGNAHLVIVGRRLPELPRARLVAADECIIVEGERLLFDDREQARLADQYGRNAAVIEHTNGWPALSRLALMSPSMSRDYLFDEVISAMSAAELDAVAIAQIHESVDDDLLAACAVECDLGELVRTVPLLDRYPDGTVRAHDLWLDAGARVATDERRRDLARAIADHLARQSRLDDAIHIALDHQLWPAAERLVVEVIRRGDGGLRAATSRAWFDAFPSDGPMTPTMRLLNGSTLALEHGVRVGVSDVQAAAREFAAADDLPGQAAALVDLGTRAWATGDMSIIIDVLDLVPALVATGEPKILEMIERQKAVEADLAGDFQGAIDAHRALPQIDISLRHQATLELLLGNGARSDALVEELVDRWPTDFNRRVRALHHFAHGDPAAVLSADHPSIAVVEARRDVLLQQLGDASVDAACGRAVLASSFDDADTPRSRDRVFVAMGSVFESVTGHDDDAAGAHLDGAIDAIGWDDPMIDGELRRFLPYMYVLSATARERLDAQRLRGHHLVQRDLCRSLLAARADSAGEIGVLPRVEQVFCSFPLSWSVELAVLLAARNDDRAGGLINGLAELAGANTQHELRAQIERGGAWKSGASKITSLVPMPPASSAHLRLFGAPAVEHGDSATSLTRARVRQLLALMVFRGRVSRHEIGDTLWPGDDTDKVANRLRVTLSQARSAIEPDRAANEAPFRLREFDGVLALTASAWTTCDVWDLDTLLEPPHTLDRTTRAMEIIGRGVVDDLREVAEISSAFAALEHRACVAHGSVGEQCLADGDLANAAAVAQSLLASAPLFERGHALRIGALLALGDLQGAQDAVVACEAALVELGVEPAPTTAMLMRRCERRTASQAAATD